MSAKQTRAASFTAMVWAGTPNELEEKLCKTPASAKSFIRGRIQARHKWASKYALGAADRLGAILVEFDSLNIQSLPVGAQRSWSAVDDYSKVEFIFKIEVRSK